MVGSGSGLVAQPVYGRVGVLVELTRPESAVGRRWCPGPRRARRRWAGRYVPGTNHVAGRRSRRRRPPATAGADRCRQRPAGPQAATRQRPGRQDPTPSHKSPRQRGAARPSSDGCFLLRLAGGGRRDGAGHTFDQPSGEQAPGERSEGLIGLEGQAGLGPAGTRQGCGWRCRRRASAVLGPLVLHLQLFDRRPVLQAGRHGPVGGLLSRCERETTSSSTCKGRLPINSAREVIAPLACASPVWVIGPLVLVAGFTACAD